GRAARHREHPNPLAMKKGLGLPLADAFDVRLEILITRGGGSGTEVLDRLDAGKAVIAPEGRRRFAANLVEQTLSLNFTRSGDLPLELATESLGLVFGGA